MAYERELSIGAEIARKAGDLALKIREGNIGIEIKSDESPVTVADKACEKLIVEELSAAFPGDGMLGEEGALHESQNGRRWIIDPIDGTRDFIRGTGAWSVLIGLEENDKVVAGHAYFPARGEMYSAARGQGACGWAVGMVGCAGRFAEAASRVNVLISRPPESCAARCRRTGETSRERRRTDSRPCARS